MTAKPRQWTCSNCRAEDGTHRVLGHITSAGDLIITAPGTMTELTRLTVVVRCGSCGATKAYSGRGVKMDVPAERRAA